MGIKIADATAAAGKFVQRASTAGGDYQKGVQDAGATWAMHTKAAKDSFALGVQQAIADGRFEKGINQTSTNRFQTRAAGVGAQRYPAGVQGAQDTYATAVKPFFDTIAALNLPARQPKGSPANYLRVQVVGEALRAKKLSGA